MSALFGSNRRISSLAMTDVGHEDAFPEPALSARCRFSQRTFARTQGTGREAPKPAIPLISFELPSLAVDRSLKWSDRFQHRSCDCRPVCSGANLRDEETGSQDLTEHRQGRDEKFERQVDFG